MTADAPIGRRPPPGPVLWCLAAAAFFGASTPASKHLLSGFGPWTLSGVLYIGAALAVAPFALRGAGGVGRLGQHNLRRLAGAVLFGGVVGPVCLLVGLRATSAVSVSLWLNLESVTTAVLARVFFKEHLGARAWTAVFLILLGSAILSPLESGPGLGILWVAFACLAWGLDNNFTSLIDGLSPSQVTFVKGAVAGVLNLAVGLGLEDPPASLQVTTLGAGLIVGGLSYGVSIQLYIAGAQQLGATRSQLIFSSAPAWGFLLAWAVLGEPMHAVQLLSAGLMAMAIWTWQRERHQHEHEHEAVTHDHWHRHDDDHHEHAHPEPVAPGTWHRHAHAHRALVHAHPHRPDLHHRHTHRSSPPER